ncbi:hypothetical protein KA057_01885 [Candidatus Gracilibacteria bacterium]|nr:hypothetical protein [Candidatus Gracilibacteria bacterium]
MVNPLNALDGGNGNVEQPQEMGRVRATILAALITLGLGISLSNVIPTEVRAKEATNKTALMAQDGGDY